VARRNQPRSAFFRRFPGGVVGAFFSRVLGDPDNSHQCFKGTPPFFVLSPIAPSGAFGQLQSSNGKRMEKNILNQDQRARESSRILISNLRPVPLTKNFKTKSKYGITTHKTTGPSKRENLTVRQTREFRAHGRIEMEWKNPPTTISCGVVELLGHKISGSTAIIREDVDVL